MKKFLALTFGILLLAAACNKQVSVQPDQNQHASTKTYTNTKFGYGFSYPANLSLYAGDISGIIESSSIVGVNSNNMNTIFDVSVRDKDTLNTVSVDLQTYAKTRWQSNVDSKYSNPGKTIGDFLTTTVAGRTAYKFSVSKSFIVKGEARLLTEETWFVFVDKNNSKYVISFPSGNLESEQILSTFKFSDSAATANWKIYMSSKYGFEFQYPASYEIDNNINSDSPNVIYAVTVVDSDQYQESRKCQCGEVESVSVSVYKNVNDIAESWLKKNYQLILGDQSKYSDFQINKAITVNNTLGRLIQSESSADYVFTTSQNAYVVSFASVNKNIADTFKLTK